MDLDWKQWADARDMAFVTSDYAIGDQMWAMARRGVTWKANTQTREYQIILAPPLLEEWTWKAVNHRQADVLTLDFLKKSGSSSVLLESNDIPGFSGSPSNVRETVALRLRRSLRMFPEHRNGGPHDRQSRQGKKNRWPEKTKCVF